MIDTLIAPTGKGLARATREANGEWSVAFLLTDQDVRCLAADQLNNNVIYAGTQGNGVLRSDDRGKSWQPAGVSGQVVKALAVSRAEPGTVYAGTKPARMFVSRDSGQSWTELEAFRRIPGRRFWFSPTETRFTAYVQGIALSPTDRNTLVVGIEAGAVVRSADGGRTWVGHRKGALRDCHSITFHATHGDWVYEAGGTGAGAAFSQSGGEQWTQPKAGLDRHYGWACAADPAQPDVWYVSLSTGAFKAHSDNDAQAGIFRTMDGSAWQRLGGGLPNPLSHMPYALVTHSDSPGHLYAGLSNGDMWFSDDHGDSWQQLAVNLKGIHRTLIVV